MRLISDPNHALPVQINRTGLRTVAFGSGETGALKLPNVPRLADVREGDLVVTSGLGDRFPGGYPVARVTRIDRQEGQTFVLVEAQPLAALDRGREVLLISATEPAESGEEAAGPPAEPAGTGTASEGADEPQSPVAEDEQEPGPGEEADDETGTETPP